MKWDLIGKQKLSTWMILKKMLKNKGKNHSFSEQTIFPALILMVAATHLGRIVCQLGH